MLVHLHLDGWRNYLLKEILWVGAPFEDQRQVHIFWKLVKIHITDRRANIFQIDVSISQGRTYTLQLPWLQMLDLCFHLLADIFIFQVEILDLRQKRTFWPILALAGPAEPAGPLSF